MDKLPENISPEMIVAYLENQISNDDYTIVQGWINASDGNKHQFEQYKVVWEETGKLIPAPVDVDIDFAWNKMSIKIDEFEEKTTKSIKKEGKVIPFKKYLLRIAAVLLPLVTISVIFILLNQKPKLIVKQTTAQSLTDTLSDGSVIALSSHSKISYPEKFKDNTREVEMEGEVFFEVKPDSIKPFIIHAENTMIKVLGTSFNVKAFDDSSRIVVSVKTGKVMFYDPEHSINDSLYLILKAGETGIYNKSTGKFTKENLPSKVQPQQNDKILNFKRSSLLEVAEELQRNYGVTVVLNQKELENFHYTANFKNASIDSIIEVMVNTLDLKVKRKGTKYILELNE